MIVWCMQYDTCIYFCGYKKSIYIRYHKACMDINTAITQLIIKECEMTLLLSSFWTIFHHLELELLTQFPASND